MHIYEIINFVIDICVEQVSELSYGADPQKQEIKNPKHVPLSRTQESRNCQGKERHPSIPITKNSKQSRYSGQEIEHPQRKSTGKGNTLDHQPQATSLLKRNFQRALSSVATCPCFFSMCLTMSLLRLHPFAPTRSHPGNEH